jgi:starch synthase
MKTGIMFADKITTVSPTYANEIRYPYYSEGLQDILNLRGGDLIGVLNGVYYDQWNPETDDNIYRKYDINTLENKEVNKQRFLREWGVGENDNPNLPMIGMVSRLAEQKGIDILMYRLEEHLANNRFRFVLIGTGESKYVDFFRYLHWKYPKNALIHIGYNESLSHKVIASSDFLLVPSRFEPCGLTQMYALKYGTIPIVRSTGGLADSVSEYSPSKAEGTGYLFYQYNADDLAYAIRRALSIYSYPPHWDIIRRNAMKMNFSSADSALEYIKVFNWALDKIK